VSPHPSQSRVWILNATLTLTAALLWLYLHGLPAPQASVRLPWWGLAVAFVLTEVCVVHIHFRHSAHSLTLGEIPLVLGLLFAAPADIVAAWMLASALVLGFQRGHAHVRVVFNVAQIGATAGLAGLVFHSLGGVGVEFGPRAWGAAAIAALAAAAVAALLVLGAMALCGERVRGSRLSATIATALLMAPTNACLALAAASVLDADPRAAFLLLAPAAVIFVAYRAYTSERAKHTTLEFLHDATRTLTRAGGDESGLAGTLAMARETFRAAGGEVCLFASPDRESGARVALDAESRVSVDDHLAPDVAAGLRALVDAQPGGRVLAADELTGAVADHLRGLGVEQAMIAALPGERRLLGVLLLTGRAGAGTHFNRDDLRLFDLLAHHVGAALEQDRLGRKVSELRDLSSELEHKAFHDPLTGLANRLLFMDRVAHALSRRTGTVGLLYIDLDDFKTINDTLGHDAGDELLRETARRLRQTLRAADTPSRLGGDEFAVMVLDLEDASVRVVAERVLAALREPFMLAGREVRVYASLGVALAASGTTGADDLLKNADVAMYVSKHGGKRSFSVYQREMEAAR
jgi:diguanylate cyclase (GGDEF)-like protein